MDKSKIQKNISRLPVSSYNKLRIYKALSKVYTLIHCSSEERKRRRDNNILTVSGCYYGQEQWLKRYCGYTDPIYAHIEHGVYFGDNPSRVGWSPEWDLGNVITFGDSRYKILKELYPDYHIVRVGPRLHYAPTDSSYYKDIKTKLIPESKTMALYPHHAVHDNSHDYNIRAFLEGAFEVGRNLGVKNYLLSLHPTDIEHGKDALYEDENVILVTGGPANIGFLPRLRAIMEIADVTYSNALGTHVGYSIYLNTPLIIDLKSNPPVYDMQSSPVKKRFYEEQSHFAKVFSGKTELVITNEQRELCDYYWGYSHIKSPEQLLAELESCKSHFNHYFRHKR